MSTLSSILQQKATKFLKNTMIDNKKLNDSKIGFIIIHQINV